ncbi:MAG: hypothetical protein BGO69_14955 [Bacteroidetes bacterium 46-16]|nr:MAG: hypothetical protein BGO69_14955 [Bacteroidetes bacterium 46-16]
MDKNKELTQGIKLKYIGRGFDDFQQEQPYMTFLGYDSHGWRDLWVNYNDKKILVSVDEVEIVV